MEDHRREVIMADGWKQDIGGPRRVAVTHPDGHRFFFEFPERWDGGHVPCYRPTLWVNGERPDIPWIEAEAAITAADAARVRGWIREH